MNGRLDVVCGPMFCGKTEFVLARVRRASVARKNVVVLIPEVDDRAGSDVLRSHADNFLRMGLATIRQVPTDRAAHWISLAANADLVVFEEAQFFEPSIETAIDDLRHEMHDVLVAGLDMDYLGQPFGAMPRLMARATDVYKLKAVCLRCGNDATHSFRTTPDDVLIKVGAAESYEARCFRCWQSAMSRR